MERGRSSMEGRAERGSDVVSTGGQSGCRELGRWKMWVGLRGQGSASARSSPDLAGTGGGNVECEVTPRGSFGNGVETPPISIQLMTPLPKLPPGV